MMNNRLHQNRDGFTLIEMVISIMVYGIVLAAALGFVAMQNKLFHRGMDRMTALQNLRYALTSMSTDIPTLGTNVPGTQPSMVYADDDVIAFSADYTSNVENDVFAAYIDPSAPQGQVTVLGSKINLPNSSFSWPDTLYRTNANTRSPAELLIYWFELDTTTTRTDDYVLFRQVNKADPEPVARDLLAAEDGAPFFRYFQRVDYASQASAIDSISSVKLPIKHSSIFHAVPSDTAGSALADSIRAVRVSFRSTNGLSGENERIASLSRIIDLPNAGFGVLMTCGDAPILGSGLTAVAQSVPGGAYAGALSWSAATDETTGELDVARYVIYRQTTPIGTEWGDPFLSIPAGKSTYTYSDQTVESGKTYRYALAAQDCTPTLSKLTESGNIVIP
jgi:prepilin-type N-terminal cleavage/methylation domain-containing protein